MSVINSGAFDLFRAEATDHATCSLCRKPIMPGAHLWRVIVVDGGYRYAHVKCATWAVRRCIEARERPG
jgi:hypothetical protein